MLANRSILIYVSKDPFAVIDKYWNDGQGQKRTRMAATKVDNYIRLLKADGYIFDRSAFKRGMGTLLAHKTLPCKGPTPKQRGHRPNLRSKF